jgi:hypothetical protein
VVIVAALLLVACADADGSGSSATAPSETTLPVLTAPTTVPATTAPPTTASTTAAPATAAPTTAALATTAAPGTTATSLAPLTDPPPPEFEAEVSGVPADVVARGTWREGCPVGLDDLRYIRMSHWDFSGASRTGEMIVHADVADDIVEVFTAIYEARFPIEEMRVETPADAADPGPDYNNTTAFTCRAVTGGSGWSQHAYGLAIDINPFHNPYLRGGVLLPENSGTYLDRRNVRPGMIVEGDAVVAAFDAIGWGWGGRWRSLKDWQHFSANGR